MKRAFILLFLSLPAFADDATPPVRNASEKQIYISELKDTIANIDSELARCEQMQTKWKIATGIGAAGTIATGTAATIQGIQIHRAKHASTDDETATDGGKK